MSVEIEEAKRKQLLDEILALTTVETEQPGDIRLQDIADALNITRSSAKARYKKFVDSGELIEKTVMCDDKRRRIVYRKAK